MSSIDEVGNGLFKLQWHEEMGAKPFLATAALMGIVKCPADERPKDFTNKLREAWTAVESLRQTFAVLLHDHCWQTRLWDRTTKNFITLKCEPCTIDEAVADYLRSLPPALGITGTFFTRGRSIVEPPKSFLSAEEDEKIRSAHIGLARQMAAAFGCAPGS
jgi:hypothetical protein